MPKQSSRNINQKQSKQHVLDILKSTTEKIAKHNKGSAADYANLQFTWNNDILSRSFDYFPRVSNTAIGIGSFMGALEIALADGGFESVTCVDHKSYLPRWKPLNVKFHKANIDTGNWTLPKPGELYDVCYFIETIEHLLWSPLPLLKWMRQNARISVISTPDDDEWPPMEIHPWTRYQHFSNIPAAAPGVKNNPLPMFHCKQYNQAEFIELLNFAGFRILEFFRTGEGHHQMCAIVEPRLPNEFL